MKTFVKLVLINMLAITSLTPLTAFAESSHLDAAKKGSRASAALDFSIVVLPSLTLRIRAPQAESPTEGQAQDPASEFARVHIEANNGSVSFHSAMVSSEGASSSALTLAAHRKLVRADSRRLESLKNLYTGQAQSGGVTYTVAQL